MERFNNFINERKSADAYVVAQALKSIENEGGSDFSAKSQAQSLLSQERARNQKKSRALSLFRCRPTGASLTFRRRPQSRASVYCNR